MKIVVSMPTSGRTEYLFPCLESLNACKGDFEILLVDDSNLDSDAIDKLQKLSNKKQLIRYPFTEKLYVNRAVVNARAYAFEQLNADLVLSIDDDMIVSPWFVKTLLELFEWTSEQGNGSYIIQSSIDTKPRFPNWNRNVVRPGLNTGTNMLISRSIWKATRPLMDEYIKKWDFGGGECNSGGLSQWFRELIWRSIPLPGDARRMFLKDGIYGVYCDSAIQVAATYMGVRTANLYVNRAITIGKIGVTSRPSTFVMHDLPKIDADRKTHKFKWIKTSEN